MTKEDVLDEASWDGIMDPSAHEMVEMEETAGVLHFVQGWIQQGQKKKVWLCAVNIDLA